MCGIAGIIENNRIPGDEQRIRRMTDAMSHRGPDAVGFYAGEGVTFGHLRLSIIDLSSAANQPFTDNSGRYVLAFNGEIYNYNEVKGQIPDYHFHTTSDTEVLLAAYIKWGPDCLRYFKGMFAFAIWDKQEHELFIARDRMGVKPLYYFANEQRLIFASEIRAILATDLVKRKLDPAALREYLSFQSVSHPYSAIEGIHQLEAGSWMRYRNGKIITQQYWDLTDIRQEFDFADIHAVKRRIHDLMLQSVERRMVSDVPIGAFLSGGIDSSAVVGLMAETRTSKLNTFNISFDEKEFDESPFAEIVAAKFNTQHTRILLKPTAFLDELQNALNAMDTPSGDGINTYVVSKAIRQHGMTVALSGIGGDELFAGYPFFSQYMNLQKRDWFWKIPAGMRKIAAGILLSGPQQGRKGRMRQILAGKSGDIDDVYPVFRQILSPDMISQLTSLAGNGAVMTSVQQDLASRKSQLMRLPGLSQVSAAEYAGYTQHTLLKDTDQMSMAVSLEVREPFFDHDLVKFVMAVPDALKMPVYPKSLLVESLKPLLPDEIVFRRKQGFLFPWNTWLRNELRSFCATHIHNMAARPFINGDALISHWQRFLANDKNTRWSEIWLFVVLEYWMQRNAVD